MSIWIITTGNSDVQLKTDSNWENPLYEEVRYNQEKDIKKCDKFVAIQQDKASELYPVPTRVLGIVYENHLQDNYDDLAFPLLDTFSQYFSENSDEKPSIIIVLLTDQRNIFLDENGDLNEKVKNNLSPFWQDTCTLKPIFEEYFRRNKIFSPIEPEFVTLSPTSEQGLDNWDKTLEVVQEEFKNLQEELNKYPQYNSSQTIYVSHQAGTPAISSAVQFASLSNFKNVKFLSSNIFFNDDNEQTSKHQLVDVSNYWIGIQIQKAKQLVIEGLPGLALSMLEEIGYVDRKNVKPRLEKMVSVFNIRESLTKGDEFDVEPAIQRVVDALNLIEIFLKYRNYIQGITLLAAAHETFLKATIKNEIYRRYKTFNLPKKGQLEVDKVIVWTQEGLGFKKGEKDSYQDIDNHLKSLLGVHKTINIKSEKIEILRKLSFPVDDEEIYEKLDKGKYGNFFVVNSNQGMLAWLCKLKPNFQPWDLLTWMGEYAREHEADRRNQLMHNLRGVNKTEVIKYLLGNKNSSRNEDVLVTYQQAVKDKFLNEINSLGLTYNDRNLYDELEAIANDIT